MIGVPVAETAPLLWIPFGVFFACLALALIGALWFDRGSDDPD